MAITHATGVRNTLADLIDTLVNTGAGTAVLKLRDATTDIVSFNLAATAFGAASGGTITLASTPIAGTAGASGDVDGFQVLDKDGNLVFSGTVTATGGGGDIEITNISVANGQGCSLTSFTYSAPA